MKRSNQILSYTFTILALALLEILLSALYQAFPPRTLFWGQVIYYFSRILAVLPPFLMLGTALGAARIRSFSYALMFVAIYAGVFLLAQVPLSLIIYAADVTELYGVTLFSYMLSSVITSLIFLLALVLIYALFVQGKEINAGEDKIFTLRAPTARALFTAALILTVYNLVSETFSVIAHLKENLYILSGEDIFDITLAFLFILFLAVFCFVAGRMAERLFPTLPACDESADDFID